MSKLNRNQVNWRIGKTKGQITYRKGRLALHKRTNNKPGVTKWTKLLKEAEEELRSLRRQLEAFRRESVTRIRHVDSEGIKFITYEEGIRTKPYNDSEGHATIGIGHLIHLGNVTQADINKYKNFDYDDAIHLFKNDLAGFEAVVENTFKEGKLKVNQNRFNACVSLAFNIGISGFRNSTVAKEIKKGNETKAANAFLLWNKPAILLPRRKRERALFLKK